MTLIELLVVMGIMSTIAGLTVPAVIAAIGKAGVDRTVDKLVRVMNQAQVLARRSIPTSMSASEPFYGVALVVDGATTYATVLRGSSAADELDPALRVPITGGNVWIAFGGGPAQRLTATVAWFYQHGTGRPIASASFQAQPINIGTAAQGATAAYTWSGINLEPVPVSPIASELSIRAVDQSRVVYIGQMAIGSIFTTEQVP